MTSRNRVGLNHSQEDVLTNANYQVVKSVCDQLSSDLDSIKKSFHSQAYSRSSHGQIQDKYSMSELQQLLSTDLVVSNMKQRKVTSSAQSSSSSNNASSSERDQVVPIQILDGY